MSASEEENGPGDDVKDPVLDDQAPRAASCAGGACGCGGAGAREDAAPALWRNLDELQQSAAFQQAVENEFPRQAVPLGLGVDRRRFMQLMGASLALGGAAACTKQPPEEIVPYVKQPEEIVPGNPLFFATAAPMGGGYALGVLATSHMGRPTKIEGNPEHPASLGSTDVFAQASVLGLYDPDRSKTIVNAGRIRTWEAFVDALTMELATQEGSGGAGLRILSGAVTSPSLAAQMTAILARFPLARWYQWESASDRSAVLGSRAAFGRDVSVRYDLAKAQVVVALDCDLLGKGPGAVRYSRDFARGRRVWESAPEGTAPGTMNRLYAVECTPSPTSTLADHRLALKPAEVGAFAAALAAALGVPGAAAPAGWNHPEAARLLPVLAKDLLAHRGSSVVAAGDESAPELHVLAHAINAHLGNHGTTVLLGEPIAARPTDPLADLEALVAELQAGKVEALLMLDVNPVYDAPPELKVADALLSPAARLRVHWGLYDDETARYCHWHVNAAHYLETWGDARAYDGTVTLQQPLIDPLYGGRSAHEVLAVLENRPGTGAREVVQGLWQPRLGGEPQWRKAVHDGFVGGSAAPAAGAGVNGGAVAAAARTITEALAQQQGYTLAFRPDPSAWDGRYANNAWLQELPRPFSKVVWDNPVLVSPRTARELKIDDGTSDGLQGRRAAVLRIEVDGASIEAPAWVLPAQADGVLTLTLGYGRTRTGKVGKGVGVDVNKLRTRAGFWSRAGAAARATGDRYELASTQGHFLVTDPAGVERPMVRRATLAEYQRQPELMHEAVEAPAHDMTLYPDWPYEGHKWGMAINLSACTGCNACVVACVAENNISVVGKDQVFRGREMHWLRIDQYYAGDYDAPSAVLNQPVPCMHCENAPCEVVCPVEATTHSFEGLNEMTYNRCVGTRYCGNNCPYKVRRFNFYKFADWTTESLKLQRNPNVSVRFRGVMEKCSYCVQRINAARINSEREDRKITDGEVRPACAQACPTEAIVFGDINDAEARVTAWKKQPLSYGMLEDLNTRPRTTYMGRLANPHPELEEKA
ncbi:MAG TPA: TAT-variant-translocated molybdopterin oxidoreductase [Thermoanaerobaculia bacterium]|jgi:molybdopterin-containing oxidoreductase family iron-sulfur binding subunit|nr:TAT-variant-translocated molybdopterin oxidoreductase [Thermoanaerobaculia bacterium]